MRRVRKPAFVLLALAAAFPLAAESLRVYVGTYTSGPEAADSRGSYRLRLDLETGALSPEGEPTAAVDPSWLVMNAEGTRLVAVNETGDSRKAASGGVSSFRVDPKSGELTLVNT